LSNSRASENVVLVIKGTYENFVKSLCETFNSGRFLWGFKQRRDLNEVLKYSESLVVFHVIRRGFAMIARVGEPVEDNKPFWPDEVEENSVIYNVPLKISNCFFDVCAKRVEPSEECFIEARDIRDYVASECRLKPKKATIQLGASVNIVRGCKAQKMLEYLESSGILVDFKPGIIEKPSWDPLAECRDFYLEVISSPYPGRVGKWLWSPAASLWKIMEDLKVGDCVLHYLSPSFQASSR